MNILFENTTIANPYNVAENLAAVSGSMVSMNHVRQMDDGKTSFKSRFDRYEAYDKSLIEFNNLRRNAMMTADYRKIDKIQEYKNYRSTVFGITFVISLILVILIFFSIDFAYTYPAVIAAAAICTGITSLITGIAVRAKYGVNVPDSNAPIKIKYRFTPEYILMSSDTDNKMMRYERIRIAENNEIYFINFEGEKYEMSKQGFNCPLQIFQKLMEEKGVRIETYIGQF